MSSEMGQCNKYHRNGTHQSQQYGNEFRNENNTPELHKQLKNP